MPEPPDWRRTEDYAYTSGLTLTQWAWEFLRRGNAYRALWAQHLELQAAIARIAEDIGLGKPSTTEPFPMISIAIQANNLGVQEPLIDPATRADRATGLRLRLDSGVRLIAPERGMRFDNPRNATMVAIFDLTRPIEHQAQEVADYLVSVQAASGIKPEEPQRLRAEPQRWQVYLRLLDAKESGAFVRKIGPVLFPHTEDPRNSAQSALRRARALVNGGYRELLRRG